MKNLAAAIIAVMKSVKGVEKNTTVGSGKFAYKGVNDKDVKEAYRWAMIENGLSILPLSVKENLTVDSWKDQYGKNKMSVFCSVSTEYLLLHISGESQVIAGLGHGQDPMDKAAGKATTYAMKYALLYTFMTPVGAIDDTDNEHSDDKEVPKTQTKPRKEVPKPRKLNEGEITKVIEWALRKNASIDRVKDFYILTEAEEKKFKDDTKAVKEETIALKGVQT
jgi:hypothetical protein